jgi:hypothetical protein
LHYFEGGTDPLGFEPRAIWRIERIGAGRWTVPERVLDAGEVPWDMKVRGGRAYMTSYLGVHYGSGPGEIDVLFRASDDGLAWAPVRAGAGAAVYHGGVSEVAFEFDADGSLWAVTRNEDGDASGFGSHVCHAAAADLAAWDCGVKSDPERYDSPEMFRHGKDLFLVARRDVGGPFDEGSDEPDFDKRKRDYLIHYSNRPKRTALYQIDRTERRVVWLFDLPSAGDTAFPSVQRTSAHTFLVANYTSPLDKPDRTWLQGQVADEGTQIYLLTLTFTKK